MTQAIQIVGERDRLLQEYRERISAAHESFCSTGKAMGSALLAAANYRREAGAQLQSLKDARLSDGTPLVRHGDWEVLFKGDRTGKCNTAVAFDFTSETARRYIGFFEKHPEPIQALGNIARDSKELLIDAGELEPGERSTPQNSRGTAAPWMSAISKAWEKLTAEQEKTPVEKWPDSQRETLKDQLRPMVELYAKL